VSEEGTLMNSGAFDGLACREGARKIVAWLAERGMATARVQYRLHDWCISRQRYWGPPIPIIYCERCGPVAVPEADLPVELPFIEDFKPDDTGVSPLARHKEWYFVKCPACGGEGRRETDVSDTFLDSAWYHLRYPSTEFADRPFDPARTKTWLPVSTYIGGNEHAVLHLLYSRFIGMVLKDLGHIHFEEPFPKLRAHGLIVKDGSKMSKSRGNVVVPDLYIQQWGADTFRMYLMFLGAFQEGGDFRETGIVGIRRFLDKVWHLAHEQRARTLTPAVERKLHQTIKKVGADTERLDYNTAIAAMMEYVNVVREEGGTGTKEGLEALVIMLAPYAPHFAEELWELLGYETSVFEARWPAHDERLATAGDVEIAVQVNGKLRSRLVVPRGLDEKAVVARVLADEAVKKFVDGQKVKKVIYVPDRLVNLVV
jgi:leucyl-tRNA synthetase